MKNNWQKKKLGEVCTLIKRGISPKYIKSGGVCVLNQKCIRDHKINYEFAQLHDNSSKKISEEKFIQIGDVLINSTGTGTLGRVAQIKEKKFETTADSHITIARPLKDLFYPDFFGYIFINLEEELKKFGQGASGQTELPREILQNGISVSYPTSLSEQKRIVNILNEVFEKIEKAKKNTKKNLLNSHELFEGYLENIFVNPNNGWIQKKLSDICEKITDGTHQTPSYYTHGITFLSSRNVTSGKLDWEHIKYIDNKQDLEMHKRVAPRLNDILLAKNGTTGVAAIVDKDIPFDIYVSLALLRPLPIVAAPFLLYFINSPVAKRQFNKRLKGVGVPNLHLEEIRQVVMSFPKNLNQQKSIVQKLDALSDQTKQLEEIYRKKLADLEELKKSVLQQAFAGKL